MHRPRILMNEQDASPSGGGAPAIPTATAPQAQGAVSFSLDDLRKELSEFKNSVSADARRIAEGIAGKKKGEPKADPAQQGEPKAAPADYQQLRARDRAFERSIRGVNLTDAAAQRMERAFELEQPEDVPAWSAAYIADLGLGKQTSASAPSQTQATPRTGPPVSDSGSPAPVTTPSDEIEPWRISEDDYLAQLRRDGYAKTGAKLRDQFHRSLRGRRVKLR